MKELYRKDTLASNINAIQHALSGTLPIFIPESWAIPDQISELAAHISRRTAPKVAAAGEAHAAAVTGKRHGGADGSSVGAAGGKLPSAAMELAASPKSKKGVLTSATLRAAGNPATSPTLHDQQQQQQQQQPVDVYIVKPASGLQGHGIQLHQNPLDAAAVKVGEGRWHVG
jgi:hypothetical protein